MSDKPIEFDRSSTGAVLTDGARVADYAFLVKPRVMPLVVFTGFVGCYVAPGHIHY